MQSLCRSTCLALLAVAFGLILTGCGGEPTSPSGVAVLRGTVLDETSGAAQGPSASDAPGAPSTATGTSSSLTGVTVTVREASGLTAMVAKDGTFTLNGLPTGTITLVFSRNGMELGSLIIKDVASGEQLELKVKVTGNGVAFLDLQRTSTGPSPSPSASPTSVACSIDGGRVGAAIELEGSVSGGTADSFTLQVQGNRAGLVAVNGSGAEFQCHPASGPNAPTPAACKASVTTGAKVHVSGMLTACDASTAAATASKVIVQ